VTQYSVTRSIARCLRQQRFLFGELLIRLNAKEGSVWNVALSMSHFVSCRHDAVDDAAII